VLRKATAALLVAIPLGIAAPAGAQTPPSPSPFAAPAPEATKAALAAYGLVVADVQYEATGRDGTVAVTLFGPPATEMPDQIAAVVWATEPLRFDQVEVRWSTGQVQRSYVDLQTLLGARPPGFDRSTVTLALLLGGGWTLGLDDFGRFVVVTAIVGVVAISVVALLVVGLVVAFVVRRRRSVAAA
jgi:hypothetical protein